MPVPNGKNETNNCKKQRRWSLIGILSKKMKLKKSQESVDFCPYDGKINQNVMRNNHLNCSTADCLIEQYTCSPRLIRRCNSLQYTTSQVSAYSENTASQPALNEWKLSQQSVYSSSSSACYSSDIGAYRSYENGNQSSSYYNIREETEQTYPVVQNVPFRCPSEIGRYQNKINCNQTYSARSKKLIGKKIPPPPPPRDPNIKAVYYMKNNRLMSRESDSTYFSQGSDDSIAEDCNVYGNVVVDRTKEPPRSRRPIRISDVETLSTESENSEPRALQTAEEAIQELEDIYNSLGLSDEDLLDRAERRDLPTSHQNMHYESCDELDCVTLKRILPKTRRSGVPDTIFDDMAYRKLNRKETKRNSFAPGAPGSFLLVLPTVYNVDKSPKPSGEPDVTLDDVVFRSRRQHLNFLKIPDPQPPFGIPLGPIVGAAPSDYLHAVPDGRRYRPSFRPRKMPDTVEDDLAFRALRRDHAYKTCIDFSFVRGNRFEIDGASPKPSGTGNRIKNDTHWIVKTERRPSSGESRVKVVLDELVADDYNRQKLQMFVKIDRRTPVVLTAGFGVNRSSKSFFCTNLSPLPHVPRKLRLTKAATHAYRPPNSAPTTRLLSNYCRPNALTTTSAKRFSEEDRTVLNIARPADDDGLTYVVDDDDDCKKRIPADFQPNFRALIRREHARGYRSPPLENAVNSIVVAGNERDQNEMIGSRGFADDNAAATSLIVVAVRPSATDLTAAKEIEEDPSPPAVDGDTLEYPPDRGMPGYLEVCLYITIYVYQLFSVNAYSTFIALIFLVALHVCRRLS